MDGSRVVHGTGPILLDELRCTGRESSLFNCSHNRLGAHDCDHSDDAGVNCIGMVENILQIHTAMGDAYFIYSLFSGRHQAERWSYQP